MNIIATLNAEDVEIKDTTNVDRWKGITLSNCYSHYFEIDKRQFKVSFLDQLVKIASANNEQPRNTNDNAINNMKKIGSLVPVESNKEYSLADFSLE